MSPLARALVDIYTGPAGGGDVALTIRMWEELNHTRYRVAIRMDDAPLFDHVSGTYELASYGPDVAACMAHLEELCEMFWPEKEEGVNINDPKLAEHPQAIANTKSWNFKKD